MTTLGLLTGVDRGRSTVGFFLSEFSLPRAFPPQASSTCSSNVATRRSFIGYRLNLRATRVLCLRDFTRYAFASLLPLTQRGRNFSLSCWIDP